MTYSEIYEIWYGNGLDYTVIDREKVDWVFSQDYSVSPSS